MKITCSLSSDGFFRLFLTSETFPLDSTLYLACYRRINETALYITYGKWSTLRPKVTKTSSLCEYICDSMFQFWTIVFRHPGANDG
jgi:hypothetical protein